jgi:flagellar biosynthesis protein FlhF
MKIKRYMAESMRAALAQVRAEQGPDAVILSSRRVAEGIEVIAAIDYDEALFAGATQRREPAEAARAPSLDSQPIAAPADETAPAVQDTAPRRVPTLTRQPAAGKSLVAAPPAAEPIRPKATSAPAAEDGYLAMQSEVKGLRELLQGQFAHMSWNDKRLREPLQASVLEQLTAMDIAPDVAMSLALLAPRGTTVKNPANIPLALLVRHLQVVDNLSPVNGGVIAVVGPTGSGKTTTIAKLAARWSLIHGNEDLALVSTDAYRIGAREQLMTYARILGAPMHTASGGQELARLLERLKSKKLILIDTAGMGPRDVRLAEQLAALQLGAGRAQVLLTLPAQGEAHALESIVRSFAPVAPAACILTKVDEAASLGAVLSTALRHKLPIAYLCNGQRVPEDLHSAHERKVWLIKIAARLKEQAPTSVSDGYLARHFGRTPAHA